VIVDEDESLLAPLTKLRRDIREGLSTLTPGEARFLVDAYYQSQDYRIQAGNQMRSAGDEEPHTVIKWHFDQMKAHENEIKRVLDAFTDVQSSGMGVWAKEIVGIGPVLAAGLLAHIDITQAPTAGHIWAFAGLDPTKSWGKGQKRPWNARLKVLTWKIGESFVKVSGNPKSQYGRIYRERKEFEQQHNDALDYAEQAKRILATKDFSRDTDAKRYYTAGKLPPAHIHSRAKRYAVKIFLSHYWEEAYRRHYHTEPPLPFPVAHLGHVHVIKHEVA